MPALQRARVTQRSATGTLTFRSAVLLGCMTAFALLTLFVRIRTGEEVRDATQEYKESEIDSSYSTLVSQGQRRLIDEPQSHQRGIPGAGQQDAADQGQAQAVSSQARPRSEFTTGQKEWSDGTLNGVPLETTAKPGAGDASEEQYEPDPYNPRCLGAPRPWLFAQPPPTHYDPPPPPTSRKGNGFASAGKGGKHGMSCAAEAPQKSRQACAEQRALDRCAAEERNADIRSPAEEALALCLKDMKQCTSKIPELAATARELQGMRMLLASRPACLLAHSAGGCAPLTANNETGLYMGNNLNLFERPNGRSIDAHHAVFRFNNEVERMVTAVDAKQEWDDSRTADHLGGATTFRFLNRKYTLDMLGKALPEELLMADHVVFWHYFSLPYLARLQDKYPELPLAVLAPDLVNWQLAVFSQLRSDLYRLGLGPFDCYRMLSSGAHGLLMSILMCDRVDIYGFSVTMDAFEAGFHHQRPSESHSWGFETLLLRLLYLAGVTDDKNFDFPTAIMDKIEKKMRAEGLSDAAIDAFRQNYEQLVAGVTGLVPEDEIEDIKDLPKLVDLKESGTVDVKKLLQQTAVLKLNGGLGTSMGLEKAKSLLVVKDGKTFLDLIAEQIKYTRKEHGSNVRFVLMNSFSTSADTKAYLHKRHSDLISEPDVELFQNKSPKIDAKTLEPVEYPEDPDMEWCPPGHGDIYPSLLGSGMLDRLIRSGIKYLFVSNSDNLGATLNLDLLAYFAKTDKAFLMEVAERTAADKKGGHLARRKADGRLMLRESAMCPDADKASFEDISKHKFFNTNNLWVNLTKLKATLDGAGGVLKLPLINNKKTVNPRDSSTTPVFQLETAMGSAIECFDDAGAVVVPRERFAPVKTCNDLFALRTDVYKVTERSTVVLAVKDAPMVKLDDTHYKLVDKMEALTEQPPSLLQAKSLTVKGPVRFKAGVVIKGDVTLTNDSSEPIDLDAGTYADTTKILTKQPALAVA
ncbi:hypothetical protein WJX72_006308 [[Myrmecia] bisecta]|uniref:UTP--glucose-1-phosphate uridylyltransferase n=1 Tax=[Myrmecia] bisecta TaxID=41462 RepID=A0AAW1R7K1_9CHLO